jgi:dihydrofolate reductase
MNTTRQDWTPRTSGGNGNGRHAALVRPLSAFMHVSVDGYFSDASGDMSFAHRLAPDPEWDAYVAANAGSSSTLLFGRKTYELMAGFWPTPAAMEMMPDVARGMNAMEKIVFSRTLRTADWSNTTVHNGELVDTVRTIRAAPGSAITVLGSGSIVRQLAAARLLDAVQVAIAPVALGAGYSLFGGLPEHLALQLAGVRSFANGCVVLDYRLPDGDVA